MLHCIIDEIAHDAVDSAGITVHRETQVIIGQGVTCTVKSRIEFCIGWHASMDCGAYPLWIVQKSKISPKSMRKG